jgi:hypothetical protein
MSNILDQRTRENGGTTVIFSSSRPVLTLAEVYGATLKECKTDEQRAEARIVYLVCKALRDKYGVPTGEAVAR